MTTDIMDRAPSALKEFKWKWFISTCAKLTVIAVFIEIGFFCPLNRALLNCFLFHPTPYPTGNYNQPEIAGCKNVDVYFKATDGNKLHAWYLKKPNTRLTILLSHGNGGNLSYRGDLIALLLDSGASVFTYDYEGFGRSEGSPSLETSCDDAYCAYQYLVKEMKIPPTDIVICGESLGTGISANLAGRVPSAAVILQCPFLSLRERAIELIAQERIYPQSFYPENALDIGAVFTKKHAPLLIIGGVLDTQLPIRHADELFAMSLEPKTYLRIPGAGHTGDPRLTASPTYIKGLHKFMETLDPTLAAKQ